MWSSPIHVYRNGKKEPLERYRHFLLLYYQLDLDQMKYDIREWETTPESGYWLAPHNHGHSHFTQIYYEYVSGHGGELIIHDPRVNANRGYPQEFSDHFRPYVFKPETGDTIVFPSYLYHTAAPFTGIIRKAKVSEIQLYSTSEGKADFGATAI